ncbi:uncharacterized protein N7469_007878 [Penicillium citrinum]|uniref:Siderophore biosynthesis n=1 Tax=Penicillium citrinum TaxID=5077 RepID=A0A9W9TKB9_PENCI|nr:uncharacterized protein N7469_007878 [Penicillium citrinum]KAJ5224375.1 hypothetical protein N7469_007878 [Penicillium citrinum]KAK5795930.1 hypothetical protein VI817_005215 [Penicillium citrinum]
MKAFTLPLILGLTGLSLAKTDLAGCVSSQTTNQWHEASMIWYVPDSGEICEFVDCGGGRAPPKTTQPGCPLYSGTATLTPNYLPGWGPNGKMAATTTTVAETASAAAATTFSSFSSSSSSSKAEKTDDETDSSTTKESLVTAAPTSSPAVSMTTTTSHTSKSGNTTSSSTEPSSTGNSAGNLAVDMGGIMFIAAAVMGGIAL